MHGTPPGSFSILLLCFIFWVKCGFRRNGLGEVNLNFWKLKKQALENFISMQLQNVAKIPLLVNNLFNLTSNIWCGYATGSFVAECVQILHCKSNIHWLPTSLIHTTVKKKIFFFYPQHKPNKCRYASSTGK